MNNASPDPQSVPNFIAPAPKPAAPAKHGCLPHGCRLYVLLGFIVLILIIVIIPSGSSTCVRGSQTKALAQAKQIGLALKLFAGDHDGNYPRQGVPVEMKEAPTTSNAAFACLFPTYTQSETIFGVKESAYQSKQGPDNVIDNPYTGKPVQTLRPGENVYGYVMGLRDDSRPDAPLVVDGTDGSGHYNKMEHTWGGTWKSGKAIVIRLDNSGAIENPHGPDDQLYVPRSDDRSKNLLEVDYLGRDVRYLDPAVAGP